MFEVGRLTAMPGSCSKLNLLVVIPSQSILQPWDHFTSLVQPAFLRRTSWARLRARPLPWLGLVPKHESTGDRTKLVAAQTRGSSFLRGDIGVIKPAQLALLHNAARRGVRATRNSRRHRKCGFDRLRWPLSSLWPQSSSKFRGSFGMQVSGNPTDPAPP